MLAPNSLILLSFSSLLVFLASSKDPETVARARAQQQKIIEQLVEQLGSKEFKVRDDAARKLREMDDALPLLERILPTAELEVRRRAELLIAVIRQRMTEQAIQRILALLKERAIEDVIDDMVLNKAADDSTWRALLALSDGICDGANKDSGKRWRLPLDFLKFPIVIKGEHAEQYQLSNERLLADTFTCDGFISKSIVFCRGRVSVRTGIADAIVFANGDVRVKYDVYPGTIMGCLIVCEGDLVAHTVHNSIVITRGTVKELGTKSNSVIIERAQNPLAFLKLFETAQAGIEVSTDKVGVRVDKVDGEKVFGKAGVKQGDLILEVGETKIASADQFRILVRRALREKTEQLLKIQRAGQILEMKVQFAACTPPPGG